MAPKQATLGYVPPSQKGIGCVCTGRLGDVIVNEIVADEM